MIAFGGKAGWMPCYISIYYVTKFNWKGGQKLRTLYKLSGDMKTKGVKNKKTRVVLFVDVPISARFPVVMWLQYNHG